MVLETVRREGKRWFRKSMYFNKLLVLSFLNILTGLKFSCFPEVVRRNAQISCFFRLLRISIILRSAGVARRSSEQVIHNDSADKFFEKKVAERVDASAVPKTLKLPMIFGRKLRHLTNQALVKLFR